MTSAGQGVTTRPKCHPPGHGRGWGEGVLLLEGDVVPPALFVVGNLSNKLNLQGCELFHIDSLNLRFNRTIYWGLKRKNWKYETILVRQSGFCQYFIKNNFEVNSLPSLSVVIIKSVICHQRCRVMTEYLSCYDGIIWHYSSSVTSYPLLI